jgi:hypothetical protein
MVRSKSRRYDQDVDVDQDVDQDVDVDVDTHEHGNNYGHGHSCGQIQRRSHDHTQRYAQGQRKNTTSDSTKVLSHRRKNPYIRYCHNNKNGELSCLEVPLNPNNPTEICVEVGGAIFKLSN